MSRSVIAYNVNLPDGAYSAKWGGWMIFIAGKYFKTDIGIRGEAIEVTVIMEKGTLYSVDRNFS